MPHLKNLTFGWWFVEEAVKLLELLWLSAVENLVLEDIAPALLQHGHFVHNSTPILDTLTNMGNRPYDPAFPSSFPSHLRRLTVAGVLLDPEAFSRFLPFFANLEELELRSVQQDLVQAVGRCEGMDGMEVTDSLVASVILRLR